MGRPRIPPHLHTRQIMLDYFAFRAEQRRLWIVRVRHAADINRGLSWEMLGERFNCPSHMIERVCKDFPRELDLFSLGRDRQHRKHRKSA